MTVHGEINRNHYQKTLKKKLSLLKVQNYVYIADIKKKSTIYYLKFNSYVCSKAIKGEVFAITSSIFYLSIYLVKHLKPFVISDDKSRLFSYMLP